MSWRIFALLNISQTIIDFFRKVQNTNLATFIVSIICVTVLAVVHFVLNPRLIRRFHFPLPIELVVVSQCCESLTTEDA